MDAFVPAVGLAAVGLAIGALSGLLGVGGGTIMIPVFRLVLGMEPLVATATSLFTIVPTSLSGTISHVRNKTCVVPLGVAAGLGGALMSPFGVRLAALSPTWLVMLTAALIIAWSAFKMFSKALKKPAASKAAADVAAGPGAVADAGAARAAGTAADSRAAEGADAPAAQEHGARRKLSRKQLAIGVVIGLAAGLASGYVGVGGGFLMVPLFLSLLGTSMHEASGTSLLAVMILAVPGVIQQALFGNIDLLAGVCIAIGTIPGAFFGARLAPRVPDRALRLVFGCFLLVAAVLLAVNEFGLLGNR
ncbi:TSUP family transporter [Eggerthellaceae bacterium zg-893]|nr:TSUP family transporter [Eggerthellaceae bacterium zg-893]